MLSAQRAHEGDEPHFHEWSEAQREALAETIWQAENVELTTVGIDIGSSTSHLMFARVHLQRKTQLLSSEFVVVGREILWRSPILFTPFLPDFTIDAARLRAFVDSAHEAAGIAPDAIDSGAVILTGEAIKRTNAEAIAAIFASQAGRFVCASAGHHMECVLAAHGSGAAAISRHTHKTVLNVDIGGGTTKFALIENGVIRGTCAVAVGARVAAEERCGELAEVVLSVIRGEQPQGLARQLLLTAPLEFPGRPQLVTFSGGVAEYVFGRETRSFGDIARPLSAHIVQAFRDGRVEIPMMDPGQGIRATVIGASQFTVQLSGKTIHLSAQAQLPVRNVPVLFPAVDLGRPFQAQQVAAAIAAMLAQAEPGEDRPVALGIRWQGEPHYQRLRELAAGIALAAGSAAPPLIVMVDRDVARLLGHILEHELGVARAVIAIDGIELRQFDYVDIGEPLQPANVVPVIIKSLLFPAH
jgi:ethanolamine utilization protein EutA